jgi:hypothetical protein
MKPVPPMTRILKTPDYVTNNVTLEAPIVIGSYLAGFRLLLGLTQWPASDASA